MHPMSEHFNNALVFLSILVAIVSAYTAFDLIDRIMTAKRRTFLSIALASVVIGIGIWSMHFIGMLAYHPGVPVQYHLPFLLLSVMLPIAASFATIYMLTGPMSRKMILLVGGIFIGLAIIGMHYFGMQSMVMPAVLTQRHAQFWMSVLIALSISFLSILVTVRFKSRGGIQIPLRAKIMGALLLGLAMAGMHYTAISGAVITPISGEWFDSGEAAVSHTIVATMVGGSSLFILFTVLAGAFLDRHRALRLAEEQEKRFISLFENSPDMVVCYDPEENRISANPAVYRVTGYSPEEVNPATFRELYGSDSEMAAVREQYRRSAQDDQPSQMEASIMNKQGKPLLISLTFFPLELNGKRYIYSIGRDITTQKRAEQNLMRAKEEAESANRVKGEFLAIMSHEIRTPLNGMIGINQIMLETELTDKQREMLLVQEKSGQALLRVINDVLDFSKIEAGTVTLSDEVFHLTGCLEECVDSFSVAAKNKGIDLSYRLAEGLPELVHGDAVRLRQILVNLVGNAVKFTESGSVLLEARLIGQSGQTALQEALIEFMVTDTGIGIDPSKVHLLFLPFSQILNCSSRGRNYEGTGLGLAICRDLVELMGGKIWVEAGRKKGAAFGFQIPFRRMNSDENVS